MNTKFVFSFKKSFSKAFYAPLKTIIFLSFVFSNYSYAIDFEKSYEYALSNDAKIKAARAMASANKERVPLARSQLLPNASINISRNHNNLVNETQSLGRPIVLQNNYYSSSKTLTVRQAIYRPQQMSALAQANAMVNDSDAQLELNESDLVIRLAENYFDVLLADDYLSLIASQKLNFNAQLEASKRKFHSGIGTRTDIDESQAKLDLLLSQELEAKHNKIMSVRRLESIIGIKIEDISSIDSSSFIPKPPNPSNLQFWIDKAEKNNPEITAMKAQVEANRYEIEIANSAYKPTLDVVAQWNKSNSDSVSNINSQYDQKSIGLQLVIPIYSGGHTNASVRQAKAAYTQALERLDATRLDLEIRVHDEFRKMEEGVLKINALQQAVKSAEEALLSNKKSFEAGIRTSLDVLSAEQMKTQAMIDLSQAKYMYLIARTKLYSLAGDNRQEIVKSINNILVN